MERIGWSLAIVLCCLYSTSCAWHDPAKDLSLYRITNDQAGHEYAKTEQFLVPVGSVIFINGLEFEPGVSTLTTKQKLIVQDVFNCLEEITENTVNDTHTVRVAEHKKLKLEIRGYPDISDSSTVNPTISEVRAKAVTDWLTYLGTPPWRLEATGFNSRSAAHAKENSKKPGRVEFIRIQ